MSAERLDQIKQMLLADPNDEFLQYALAIELEKAGQVEKAIEQLLMMKQSNENYLPLYYKLGKLYEALQIEDKAIDIYKSGLLIAQKQKNRKTEGELNEAIWMLEE